MSKNDKKLVPELRFPEFKSFDGWSEITLNKLASRVTLRNTNNRINRVLTNSAIEGVVDQRDYFDKDIANKNNITNYFVVEFGDYVYNPRVSSVAPVGPISKNKLGTGVMSPLYTVFKFHNDKNDFYEQYFKSTHWHAYLRLASNSGARYDRMAISNDDFMRMPLPYTHPDEQKKIADCLTSIDELISAQTNKVESLKNYKKGLMQNLFPAEGETIPKLHFPEFNSSNEWQQKQIGDLLKIGSGKDYKHLSKGTVPVYGSGGYMSSVNDFLYDGESACIGRKGTINKPMFLSGKFWTVDTLFYTHSYNDCLPKFVFYIFQNINWYNYNEAGGVPSLSKSTIEKIQILLPLPEEQQKIVDCLTVVDDLIGTQSNKLDSLIKHKKGLMQQLFPSTYEGQK